MASPPQGLLTPVTQGTPSSGYLCPHILSPCTTLRSIAYSVTSIPPSLVLLHPGSDIPIFIQVQGEEQGNKADSTMNYESHRTGLILYSSKAPSHPCFQLPSMRWAPSSLNSRRLAPRRALSGQLDHQPALPNHAFIVKCNKTTVLTVVLGFWDNPGHTQRNEELQGMFLQKCSHSPLFTGSSKQSKHRPQHPKPYCIPFSQATSQLISVPHNGSRGLPEQRGSLTLHR